MKLTLLLVLAVLWTAPVCADSDIIARWTEIYARRGLAFTADELSRRQADGLMSLGIGEAKEEMFELLEQIQPGDYEKLLAVLLDRQAPFYVRQDAADYMRDVPRAAWPVGAVAFLPGVSALAGDSQEVLALRERVILLLASTRHVPAGETLYRLGSDSLQPHVLRLAALKAFPLMAPQLFDGIPERYLVYVQEHRDTPGSIRGDTGAELMAWVKAAGYDTMNVRELTQLEWVAEANLGGISYAAQRVLQAQNSNDTVAGDFAVRWREVPARPPDGFLVMAFQNLIGREPEETARVLREKLVDFVRQRHISERIGELQELLSFARVTVPKQYPVLLAAVEQALAEERARAGSGGQAP